MQTPSSLDKLNDQNRICSKFFCEISRLSMSQYSMQGRLWLSKNAFFESRKCFCKWRNHRNLAFRRLSSSSTASPLHPKLPKTPHLWDFALSFRITAPNAVATWEENHISEQFSTFKKKGSPKIATRKFSICFLCRRILESYPHHKAESRQLHNSCLEETYRSLSQNLCKVECCLALFSEVKIEEKTYENDGISIIKSIVCQDSGV